MFRVISVINNDVESKVFYSSKSLKAYINILLDKNAYIEVVRLVA